MIDTHAHINVEPLINNIENILENAKKNGVNKIVAIGMDYQTSIAAINLAEKYENIYAAVGVHPSYVDNSNHHQLDKLYQHQKVIAVGEIGLDFYHTDRNKDKQLIVFEEQVRKAIKLKLPIIIHTRNSFSEAYEIVKKYQGQVKGVFHCFSSTFNDAIKAINLGFYIGFDGPITFKKNNKELINIIENIDIKHMLIETDSPYLSPEPVRHLKNEPANLKYIAEKLAEIKKISLEEVINITTNNAKELFKLEE